MSFQLHPILDAGQPVQPGTWYAVSPEDESAAAVEREEVSAAAAAPCRAQDHRPPCAQRQRVPGPGSRVGACASFLADEGGEGGKVVLTAGATPEGPLSDVHELCISKSSVEWWSLPSSGLPPRYEHAAFFVGQDLAVYGGAEEKGPLSDVWKYVNGKWLPVCTLGPPPPPRTFHSTTSAEGKTLLIYSGGSIGSDPVEDKKLHVFDAKMSVWSSPATSGPAPSPRQGHVSAVVGRRLFLHGGMAGDTIYADLHTLDLDRLVWSQPGVSGELPPPLAAHGCAVVGDRLFLFGGLSHAGASDTLYCLNTAALAWEAVELSGPPPPARLDLAMCSILLPVPTENDTRRPLDLQSISRPTMSEAREGIPSVESLPLQPDTTEEEAAATSTDQKTSPHTVSVISPEGFDLTTLCTALDTASAGKAHGTALETCGDRVKIGAGALDVALLPSSVTVGGATADSTESVDGGQSTAVMAPRWRLAPALIVIGGMDTTGHLHNDTFVYVPDLCACIAL